MYDTAYVKGVDAFLAQIYRAEDDANRASEEAAERSARELEARIKLTLKRGDPRHGHLIDTLKLTRVSAKEWRMEIGDADHPYAVALEFGHAAPDGSRVAPQRFFFPSVKIVNKRHAALRRRLINKAIREVVKAS